MSETTQTTLEQFDNVQKGDEITFNDRVQPLSVKSVSEYTERAITLEGPRGGKYRMRKKYDGELVVARDASESWESGSDYVGEELVTELEIVTAAVDVEPPAEIGDSFKRQETLECVNHTGEWWGYEITDLDREAQEFTVEIVHVPESTSSSSWVETKTHSYDELAERVERDWTPVDDLETDPDAAPNRGDADDATEADAQLVTDGGRPEWRSSEEAAELISTLEAGDEIEIPNRGRWTVVEARHYRDRCYDRPSSFELERQDGSVETYEEYHLEPAFVFGAEIVRESEGESFVWAEPVETEADDEPVLMADGSGIRPSDGEEWCPDCQRFRLSCVHSGDAKEARTDGGCMTDSERLEYEERAEQLADETVLTDREAQVAALKEHDLSHQEVADVLGLSRSTVGEYVGRIGQSVQEAQRTIELLDDEQDLVKVTPDLLARLAQNVRGFRKMASADGAQEQAEEASRNLEELGELLARGGYCGECGSGEVVTETVGDERTGMARVTYCTECNATLGAE